MAASAQFSCDAAFIIGGFRAPAMTAELATIIDLIRYAASRWRSLLPSALNSATVAAVAP